MSKLINLDGLTQVVNKIKELINTKVGSLDKLNTADKNNLVDAVNEINTNSAKMGETLEDIEFSVGELSNLQTDNKDNLVNAINEVFQSGTSVKQELVATLVAKGLEATSTSTFEELVGKVETDLVKPVGNAVASNVLTGKTFINNTGSTITGTMTNNGSKTITPSKSNQTLGAGYYSGITINGDADLVAANILSGKNIFGVAGTAKAYPYPSWYSTSNTWIKGANMPSARNYCMSGFVNNKFYVLGGHDSNYAYNLCHYYDPSTNKWTALANSPYSYRDLGSAVIGTKIYGIGGVKMPGDEVGVTLIYDTSNNSWSTCAGMAEWSQGSGISAIVPVGTKIYVIGAAYNKYIQFLDSSSKTWTSTYTYAYDSDGYLYGGAGTAIGNNVYIFGNYRDPYRQYTLLFNASTSTWTKKANMPALNCYSVAIQYKSKIHVLGGASNNNVNWLYDQSANTWTTKAAMPTGKSNNPIGFSYDGKLFVTGGGNATTQIYIS